MARSCSCKDFNRSQLLRAGIAQAGRGLPSIEPGMPLPAGTGMDRRSFLLRSRRRACWRSTAPRRSRRAHFEDGHRRGRRRGAAEPAGARLDLHGRRLGRAVGARAREGSRATTNCARRSGAKKAKASPFSEDETLMWHPQAAGLAQLHGEGKVTVFPAIGYDPPDESHFTSRHYWEVGELNTQTRSGWMGRYLDIAGNPGNPLQGLSLDYSLAPALATARVPVAAVSSPVGLQLLGLRPGRTAHRADARRRSARSARCSAPSPALAQARAASQDTNIIRNADRAVRRTRRQTRLHLAGHLSDQRRRVPAAPGGARGDARRRSAADQMRLAERRRRLRHPLRRGRNARHATSARRSNRCVAFQRDLEARGIDDRVVIQLWSEFGRRPQENGSGTDHGAAGLVVPDRQPREGQNGRRIPGPDETRRKRKPRSTPPTSARCTRACSAQWLQTEAGLVIPGAGTGLPGPSAYGTVPQLFE